MKTLITLILMGLTSNSFAGGSGGGGVLASANRGLNPEIVYNIKQDGELTQFAYGQFINNEWTIQNIELINKDLQSDYQLSNALEKSKVLNNWVEIR